MAGNPALWADVKRDLDVAESTCAVAVSRAKSLKGRGDKMDPDVREDRERMVGSLLHDCYSAMEASLERLIVAIDGDRPIGTDYHAQLIQRAATEIEGVRGAIISNVTAADLQALRSFRHSLRHAYGAYEYSRALPNVSVAARVWKSFEKDVKQFAVAQGILRRDPGEVVPE